MSAEGEDVCRSMYWRPKSSRPAIVGPALHAGERVGPGDVREVDQVEQVPAEADVLGRGPVGLAVVVEVVMHQVVRRDVRRGRVERAEAEHAAGTRMLRPAAVEDALVQVVVDHDRVEEAEVATPRPSTSRLRHAGTKNIATSRPRYTATMPTWRHSAGCRTSHGTPARRRGACGSSDASAVTLTSTASARTPSLFARQLTLRVGTVHDACQLSAPGVEQFGGCPMRSKTAGFSTASSVPPPGGGGPLVSITRRKASEFGHIELDRRAVRMSCCCNVDVVRDVR